MTEDILPLGVRLHTLADLIGLHDLPEGMITFPRRGAVDVLISEHHVDGPEVRITQVGQWADALGGHAEYKRGAGIVRAVGTWRGLRVNVWTTVHLGPAPKSLTEAELDRLLTPLPPHIAAAQEHILTVAGRSSC